MTRFPKFNKMTAAVNMKPMLLELKKQMISSKTLKGLSRSKRLIQRRKPSLKATRQASREV